MRVGISDASLKTRLHATSEDHTHIPRRAFCATYDAKRVQIRLRSVINSRDVEIENKDSE